MSDPGKEPWIKLSVNKPKWTDLFGIPAFILYTLIDFGQDTSPGFSRNAGPRPFVEDLGGSRASLGTNFPSAEAPHSRPQSLMGAWAQGPGDSGDTGFEVLDFRTSGHCRFKTKLEDSLSKALNHLNLQSLTLLQEQVNAIRKSDMTRSPKI